MSDQKLKSVILDQSELNVGAWVHEQEEKRCQS